MIINKNDSNSIKKCAKAILDKKVVVIPCDTIYGLSSLYIDGNQVLKNLKGRDANKPFLVLATKEQAISICKRIPNDILNTWPASLTVILETKSGETLGIRVPKDDWLQDLLNEIGSPIYSTSVNISGEPSLLNFKDILNQFEDKVELCIFSSNNQGTTPSTLIDATNVPYKLIRQGSFDVSDLIKIK